MANRYGGFSAMADGGIGFSRSGSNWPGIAGAGFRPYYTNGATYLLYVPNNSAASILNLKTGATVYTLGVGTNGGAFAAVAWAPDRAFVAYRHGTGGDSRIEEINLTTGAVVRTVASYTSTSQRACSTVWDEFTGLIIVLLSYEVSGTVYTRLIRVDNGSSTVIHTVSGVTPQNESIFGMSDTYLYYRYIFGAGSPASVKILRSDWSVTSTSTNDYFCYGYDGLHFQLDISTTSVYTENEANHWVVGLTKETIGDSGLINKESDGSYILIYPAGANNEVLHLKADYSVSSRVVLGALATTPLGEWTGGMGRIRRIDNPSLFGVQSKGLSFGSFVDVE